MRALLLLCLVAIAALIGVVQSQSSSCYGRYMPQTPMPSPRYEPYFSIDDLNALLILAKAIDSHKSTTNNNNDNKQHSDINFGEIINKLINALIFATTRGGCECGNGGSGGGSAGSGSSGHSSGSASPGHSGGSASPGHSSGSSSSGNSNGSSPLINLGLLTGDDLLNLMLAGKDVLNLGVGGKGDDSGGAASKNDGGSSGGAVSGLLSGLL